MIRELREVHSKASKKKSENDARSSVAIKLPEDYYQWCKERNRTPSRTLEQLQSQYDAWVRRHHKKINTKSPGLNALREMRNVWSEEMIEPPAGLQNAPIALQVLFCQFFF